MDKKGSFFLAFFTVVAVFVFIVFMSMNKERVLERTKIVNAGETPEIVINFTLDEEEMKLFLDKAIEYSSFKALKKLGDEGGILKDKNCEKINSYVVWKGECYFSDNLQKNFFSRFKVFFGDYIKRREGLDKVGVEWRIDENNKFVIETDGVVELNYKGVKYGFEPDNKYILDYNFEDYTEILRKANECIKNEENKGVARNNLFEDCRNDKDFKWEIKIEDKHVLFDVSRQYKNLGNVVVRFAIPYNQ